MIRFIFLCVSQAGRHSFPFKFEQLVVAVKQKRAEFLIDILLRYSIRYSIPCYFKVSLSLSPPRRTNSKLTCASIFIPENFRG